MKRKAYLILAAILVAILLSSCNVQQPTNAPTVLQNDSANFHASDFEIIEYTGDGYIRVSTNGKYGILKNGGEVVIEPQYDWLSPCLAKNGYRLFRQNDLYGYLDENGNVVIEAHFEDAYMFSYNGTAIVRIGLTFYLIDETGEIIGLAN